MAPRAELTTALFWACLAAALACGLGSQMLLALDPQAFAVHWFRQPSVLLAVHLSTLGFLVLLVLGVLSQFMPMLLGRALASTLVAGLCLGLFFFSALLLLAYFAVWRSSSLAWAAIAGLLLSLGTYTALAAGPVFGGGVTHRLSRATLASALAYLLLAAGLGSALARGLLGAPLLAGEPLQLLKLHLHLGLFGFGALVVFGVSYELLPMFNLAKGYPTWPGWAALGLVHVGLLCLAAQTLSLGSQPEALHGAWAISLSLAALFYVVQMLWISAKALRRQRDASIWAWRATWAWLLLTAALGLRLELGPPMDAGVAAAYFYLGLFGVLGGAIFSQLQKMVPLLAWYDRFAPLAGKAVVPTSAQLLDPRLAWACLGLHSAAVIGGLAGLSLASPGLIRVAGALGSAAFVCAIAFVLGCRYSGRALPLPTAAAVAPLATGSAASGVAGAAVLRPATIA